MSLLMIKQYVHLRTLQRHADSDGKIEQYHREVKQTTGIAKCQARNSKAQRKHIITAILSWIVMHAQAISRKITIYQLKNEPLEVFQRNIWRNPYTAFSR